MPDNGLDFAEHMRERIEPPEPYFDRLEEDTDGDHKIRRGLYTPQRDDRD